MCGVYAAITERQVTPQHACLTLIDFQACRSDHMVRDAENFSMHALWEHYSEFIVVRLR